MYMQMPNHPQQQGGRGRRHEDLNAAFRSPLLEEFRNAKDHKWELKVCGLLTRCCPVCLRFNPLGHLWICRGVQYRPAWIPLHTAEDRDG